MAVTSSYRKMLQSPVLGSRQTGSLSRMVRYHSRFCSPGRSPCEACGMVGTSLLVSPAQLGAVVEDQVAPIVSRAGLVSATPVGTTTPWPLAVLNGVLRH